MAIPLPGLKFPRMKGIYHLIAGAQGDVRRIEVLYNNLITTVNIYDIIIT